MGGAIIYLVIVAVWAVVLVPRWLRAHDSAPAAEDTTSPYVDSPQGRVLRRRTRRDGDDDAGSPWDATPARTSRDTAPAATSRRSYQATARAHRAAVRRRVVLGLLLLAVVGCSTAAAYDFVPWWSVGAPALLIPLYVVHVRRVIVAEHARQRRLRRAQQAQARAEAELPKPTSVHEYRARRAAQADQHHEAAHADEAPAQDIRRAVGG